ncbi:MAG: hypothetical protein ACYTGH_22110 [Planctomycetota bacterium]
MKRTPGEERDPRFLEGEEAPPQPGDEVEGILQAVRVPTVYAMRLATRPGNEESLREDIQARWYTLNLEEVPEVVVDHLYTYSAAERIARSRAAFNLPLRGEWRLVGGAETVHYCLDEAGDAQADSELLLFDLNLTGPLPHNWQMLTGLHLHAGPDSEAMGPELGLRWSNEEGRSLSVEGTAWAAWDDNTLAAEQDGRFHEARVSGQLPLSRRFLLSADVAATQYALGSEAPGGHTSAGRSWEWTLRLDRRLVSIPGRSLAEGFLTAGGREADFLGSGLSIYGEASQKRYTMERGFEAVPVTPQTNILRVGADASLAVTRHLGLSLSGYLGQDNVREIVWNQLYGASFRLIVLPTGRMRLWFEGGVDTEAATGIGAARTQRLGGGLNVNF